MILRQADLGSSYTKGTKSLFKNNSNLFDYKYT